MVKVAMVFLDLDLLQVRLNLSRGGTETRSTSMVNHNWLWNTWSRLRSWLTTSAWSSIDLNAAIFDSVYTFVSAKYLWVNSVNWSAAIGQDAGNLDAGYRPVQ